MYKIIFLANMKTFFILAENIILDTLLVPHNGADGRRESLLDPGLV